mgnify:CR=1 FL=1
MPPCAVVLTLLTLLVENLAQDEQPCRCLELASGSGSDCWQVTPWLEENGLPASDCSRYYDNFGGGRGCRIDHDNGDRCDGFVDEPYTPCDPDPADAVLCGRIPTCADANGDGIVDDPHDCSASPRDLDGSPHSITCALAGCTDAECCTRCSAGYYMDSGACTPCESAADALLTCSSEAASSCNLRCVDCQNAWGESGSLTRSVGNWYCSLLARNGK